MLTLVSATFALQASDLKVDYLRDPISIQNPSPSFSFSIHAGDTRGVLSTGYQLEVSQLNTDGTLASKVWSTDVVNSNRTTFIQYPSDAPALKSNTDYSWSVQVLPGTDKAASSTFSTALMATEDWDGSEYIQAAGSSTAAQMRKEFSLPAGAISRARAFFAMPGYGKLLVNGNPVDGIAGTRTWSQYDKRTIYGCYDIKDDLVNGANAVGVSAGKGWYGHFGYGPPAFRLVIIATVGSQTIRVGSDKTWVMTAGPITSNDEYNGEAYDARKETPGWSSAGYTPGAEGAWEPVVPSATASGFHLSSAVLDSMSFAPIAVMHEFTAKFWKEPSPGVYVFDFEQNLSGWIRLKLVFCSAGTTIQFRHAELLQHPPYGPVDGSIYVGNLRGAKATDTYICKGDPDGEEWQPSFTQHGFRHVEVTGLEEPPTLDMLTAINVRSAVEQAGSISFSDPMMNNVQHNLLWGQATNLMMVPTDCDQRDERYGWTGDSALTAEEASNNFDLGAFYHNWLQMIDESSPNGAVPDTIPRGPGAGNSPASKSADASWASVYPSVAYALLKYNGDTTIVKHWEGLQRFIDNEWGHIGNTTKDITKMFAQFGDWCPPPPAKRITAEFTAGFSFVNDVAAVVEIARNVGTPSEVAKYEAILAEARTMFHKAWYDTGNGVYGDGGQTAQVLALQIGAPPTPAIKAATLAHLVNDIVEVHGNHTTCGIIGWRWELDVLSANGYGDVAYALITQQTYPGYGYEILNEYEPATTVWELWNGDTEGPGMNSRDHIMFGGPGKWIYNYVGGIAQTADSIGFEHIVLTPPATLIEQAVTASITPNSTISTPLEFATAGHKTLRGMIELGWGLPQHKKTGTCDVEPESTPVDLECKGSTIASVAFAAYGVFTGDCTNGLKHGSTCNSGKDFQDFVTGCCVGKESCSYSCENSKDPGRGCKCGNQPVQNISDPCFGTEKRVAGKVVCATSPSADGVTLDLTVEVPAGSDSQLVVPLLGVDASKVTITEGGKTVFAGGAYQAGVDGITGAVANRADGTIVVSHGSGKYVFQRVG
jgi:alpha-L-rhamnosidase